MGAAARPGDGGVIDTVVFWSIVAVLLGLAERAAPEDGHRTPTDARSGITDAGWMAMHLASSPVLGLALASATGVIGARSPLREVVHRVPWALQAVIAFAIAELAAYWVHRLQHAVPALWRMHSVHHSSESLRWWSAVRSHPLDTVVSHAVPLACAAATGVAASALVPYVSAVLVVTVFAHADVHVPRTWWRGVVVTPRFHRAHHRADGGRSNLARVLPVFDVVFRTTAAAAGSGAFGATGVVPRHGVRAQLAWGFGLGRRPEPATAVSE